ncbi:Maf family protein [Frankia sp. AgKG'84/4]|uniref:Maf family protein n=1 Tax=Frankia sp. AgKG'84/4 TaxID=573490 RepID=UPI00200E7E97|nr:Maf family protein [Frankia sp. AgKG'84/4]MCL9794568.1 Maf family protein [Frankia sp. AgKG'84/4]
MRVVLASASPRRHALLGILGVAFDVDVSGVDESQPRASDAAGITAELAELKARAVAGRHPGRLVLGSDTLVELDGRVLGKPATPADALAMLRALRGRTHRVVTAVVVLDTTTGVTHGGVATTAVTMREVPDAELAAYVATGEAMDAAGAYAIQGGAAGFVTAVDGDLDTVIGLPTTLVRDLLTAAGAAPPDPDPDTAQAQAQAQAH